MLWHPSRGAHDTSYIPATIAEAGPFYEAYVPRNKPCPISTAGVD